MDDFRIIVYLLPILFMIHDFEEIIFFKPWIKKNGKVLKEKYPFLAKKIIPMFEKLSVPAFSVAVFEEFLILSVVTCFSLYFDSYIIWLAVFMAFSIHIFIHIIQWFIFRKYIPAIATSIISLPYCIYALIIVIGNSLFTTSEIILCSIAGVTFMIINLAFAHNLGKKYDQKYNN